MLIGGLVLVYVIPLSLNDNTQVELQNLELPVVKQGFTLYTDLTLEAFVLPRCYAGWGL